MHFDRSSTRAYNRAVEMTAVAKPERLREFAQNRLRAHGLVFGCYVLLAVAATFPLVLRLDQLILANGPGSVDGFLGIWNVWWTAQALSSGQDPYFTPLLFYPDGLDLFWQTLSLPQGLLALPITLLFGPLPAYNLLILAGFVLGGYFSFLFVRHVLGWYAPPETPVLHLDLAALLAGAIYALAPFHLQKVVDAQLEVASIQWVPLYLLVLHMFLERRRWPWLLASGLLLLWVGLGTWYYGLFCLIYTGLAAGLWALKGDDWRDRCIRLAWGLAPLAIWLLIMAPRLYSLLLTGDTYLGDARIFKERSAADLVAFFLPSPLHPLWGEAISRYYTGLYPQAMLWNVAIGLVGLLLALIGARAAWRSDWRWGLLLIITASMAMGETLKLFGWRTGLPMPYALIADLPGIRSSHRPNHFVIVTILLTALFAAHGVLALLRRRPQQPRLLTAGLLLAVLLVDGLALPWPTFSRPISPAYAQLPPADGALLPIPTHLNISNSEHLWYQTVHGWPIIGGFIGREPPYPFGVYYPGIRELRFGSSQPEDILRYGWPELATEALAALDIRYIMVHESSGSKWPLMREMTAEMSLEASYRDELLEIYPLPRLEQPRPLVYLGAGWGDLEQDGSRRWRWIEDEAQIRLYNPLETPQVVTLDLYMESFQRDRILELRLDERPHGSLEVSRAAMRRSVRLLLEPGEHVLYLQAAADPHPDDEDRELSIAFLEIGLR